MNPEKLRAAREKLTRVFRYLEALNQHRNPAKRQIREHGFKASTLSHTLGPLRADIARDLQLHKFNLHIIQPEPRVFAPSPDGRGLLFYNSAPKTVAALSHLPLKEGARFTEFPATLEEMSEAFDPTASTPPPPFGHPPPHNFVN